MKAIFIDFDGTESDGVYKVYPANEESEPDFVFQGEFYYGRSKDEDPCVWAEDEDLNVYSTKDGARQAARSTALHIAKQVDAIILCNELERA